MLSELTPFEWVQGIIAFFAGVTILATVLLTFLAWSEKRSIKAKQIEQRNMNKLLDDIRLLKGEKTGDYTPVPMPVRRDIE